MADYRVVGGQDNIAVDVEKFGLKNRMLTESISIPFAFEETETGNGYNINTGEITLTGSATTSGVLYIKNNEEKDLVIQNIFYILGNSTGGTGDLDVTIVRNPTTGTLISNATDVSISSNRNYGSNLVLTADTFKGTEGATITNGEDSVFTILSSAGTRVPLSVGGIVLTKGASLAIKVKTQTSNSSMRCVFAAELYRVTLVI